MPGGHVKRLVTSARWRVPGGHLKRLVTSARWRVPGYSHVKMLVTSARWRVPGGHLKRLVTSARWMVPCGHVKRLVTSARWRVTAQMWDVCLPYVYRLYVYLKCVLYDCRSRSKSSIKRSWIPAAYKRYEYFDWLVLLTRTGVIRGQWIFLYRKPMVLTSGLGYYYHLMW